MVVNGTSVCRAFTTGYKFDLADHFQSSLNTTYILTEIEHTASVADSYNGDEGTGTESYSNHFQMHSCDRSVSGLCALRRNPSSRDRKQRSWWGRAKIRTAATRDDGGEGEEIWVDKLGRVTVVFPWDRTGKCSCRVRVSQNWAGQGWGSITIPRVGQEVIVSFIEGDPDRPIITGRVYNAEQTVPYTLPDNQTRSTFMTRSSTGGGTDNYNELRFEDKAGSEQIFLRGEKDLDTRLKNDIREYAGNNRSLIVKKDQLEKVEGDLHNQVTGNLNQKIGQTLSLQIGQNLYEKSGTNFAHEAGQAIHLKAGMTVVLEAGTELTLKVGGNFIDINSTGVTIVGTMVMINSGGAAGSGGGSSPTDPKDPDEADDGTKGTKMN